MSTLPKEINNLGAVATRPCVADYVAVRRPFGVNREAARPTHLLRPAARDAPACFGTAPATRLFPAVHRERRVSASHRPASQSPARGANALDACRRRSRTDKAHAWPDLAQGLDGASRSEAATQPPVRPKACVVVRRQGRLGQAARTGARVRPRRWSPLHRPPSWLAWVRRHGEVQPCTYEGPLRHRRCRPRVDQPGGQQDQGPKVPVQRSVAPSAFDGAPSCGCCATAGPHR